MKPVSTSSWKLSGKPIGTILFPYKTQQAHESIFERNDAPDNLWVGVTVENKRHGLPRLKDLQQTNAKNKHICCEPYWKILAI